MNRRALLTLAVPAFFVSPALAAPDLSTPKAAYKSYQQALNAGDFDTLRDCVLADEKRLDLLRGQIAYLAAERRFRNAVIKALPRAEQQLPDPAIALLAAIDNADVKVQGERAMLRTDAQENAVEFQRQGNAWKLDLNVLYADEDVANIVRFRDAVAGVMDGMIADLEAGKFASYEQVTQALQSRVLMRTALPQDEPATQPSTTPAEQEN